MRRVAEISPPSRRLLAPPYKAPGQAAPVVCCVIPCYNVASLCGPVVREAGGVCQPHDCHRRWYRPMHGRSLRRPRRRKRRNRVRVLSSAKKPRQGVALLAGFRQALADHPFDVLVTLRWRPSASSGGYSPPRTVMHRGAPALGCGEFGEQFDECRHAQPSGQHSPPPDSLRSLYTASPQDTQSGCGAHGAQFRGGGRSPDYGSALPKRNSTSCSSHSHNTRRICTAADSTVYQTATAPPLSPGGDRLRLHHWALFSWLPLPHREACSSCLCRERRRRLRETVAT